MSNESKSPSVQCLLIYVCAIEMSICWPRTCSAEQVVRSPVCWQV